MLHRFFWGGKLPSINNLALAGKKGSNGCSSMFNKEFMKFRWWLYSCLSGQTDQFCDCHFPVWGGVQSYHSYQAKRLVMLSPTVGAECFRPNASANPPFRMLSGAFNASLQ